MLDNKFKKSATEKLKSMDSTELKKAFKEIGSEPETNEEWFDGLPTTKKSEFMAKMVTEAIKEHTEHGATRCESVIWWDEWLKGIHE